MFLHKTRKNQLKGHFVRHQINSNTFISSMNSFYHVCCLYLVAKRSCKAYSIFFQSSDALVLWENNIYSPRPFIDCAKRRYGSKSYQMEWIYLISLLCQLVISGMYIYWNVRKIYLVYLKPKWYKMATITSDKMTDYQRCRSKNIRIVLFWILRRCTDAADILRHLTYA